MNALMKPPLGGLGVLRPNSIAELDIFSQRAAASGMVPQQYAGKPGAIFICIQFGSELGLSPMQSLINIAVVGNRPTIFGDALPGLCRQSPVCEDIIESWEGEGDTLTAWCEARRVGKKPVRQSFSVSDAKKAGLWGKTGPWTQYPRRMLQMRARSWACRDAFPDVLRGLIAYEEAIDVPKGEAWAGPTIDVAPERDHPKAGTFDHRAAINAETPIPPKRQTAREWLTAMHTRLAACTTLDEVEEIAASPEVRRALEGLRNGALMELNALLADAMERLQARQDDAAEAAVPAEDDTFPGDKP